MINDILTLLASDAIYVVGVIVFAAAIVIINWE